MPDASDSDSIRDYAEKNSESAFARLVERHINFVYSVALRCAGNAEDAKDVTQAVFIILAKKASGLRDRASATGWLYETTRLTSARLRWTDIRRRAREQEAFMQSELNNAGTACDWRRVAPHLEEGMARLGKGERALLALRYFEKKTGAETAALLGIQEWAARKRATRALEKLRKFFARRGISLTATAIAAAISAHSVQAAPSALAKSAIAAALGKGALAGGSTLTLVKGALNIMALSTAKTIAAGAAIACLAGLLFD